MHSFKVWQRGEVLDGQYEVLDLEGMGGLGLIYRVKRGDDVFAVKACKFTVESLAPEEKELFVRRLQREYQVLKSLSHPNIVRAHALGWHEGLPFYVMDLLSGVPFHLFIREAEPSLFETVGLFAHAVEAMAHLHERGICHRDFKPGNLFVSEKGVLLLHDFGLCKPPLATPLTGPEGWLGTLEFTSPEHSAHLRRWHTAKAPRRPFEFTLAHDVHSMGVSLYQAMTSVLPFTAPVTAPMLLLKQIEKKAPRHPCKVRPAIPNPLGRLTLRMLEKDPRRRLPDACAVRTELAVAMKACEKELESSLRPARAPATARRSSPRTPARVTPPEGAAAPPRLKGSRWSWVPRIPAVRWSWNVPAFAALVLAVALLWLGRQPPPDDTATRLSSVADSRASSAPDPGAFPVQPSVPSPSFSAAVKASGGHLKRARRAVGAAVVCTGLSCVSGPAWLPKELGSCSAEEIASTRSLNIPLKSDFWISITNAEFGKGFGLVREGPIEARVSMPVQGEPPPEAAYLPACRYDVVSPRHGIYVLPEFCQGPVLLPSGSRLKGRGKIEGNRFHIRFDKLQILNGPEVPFCGIAIEVEDDRPGLIINKPNRMAQLGIAPPGGHGGAQPRPDRRAPDRGSALPRAVAPDRALTLRKP